MMHRNRNLAARMGRWSAAHWKTATLGWLAFVVAAFLLGGMVGTTMIDTSKPGPGESGRMDEILDAGFEQPAAESVLIQSHPLRVGTPAFDSAVEDVVARRLADPGALAMACEKHRKDRRRAVPVAIMLPDHVDDPDVIPHDLERYDGKRR